MPSFRMEMFWEFALLLFRRFFSLETCFNPLDSMGDVLVR